MFVSVELRQGHRLLGRAEEVAHYLDSALLAVEARELDGPDMDAPTNLECRRVCDSSDKK